MNDPLIGARLDDRYRVTGVLGRGGMGTVYEGVHEKLGRAVAIKVLGPNTATDPVVVERFLREARIASSLGHGNIVDVSDLGRLQDGRPYLVMPRVHGVDFHTLLQREAPMPAARVAELLRGVAAALDLVHAKGLAHRDVKPENLMHVLHDDGSETVMLTDFGIASLIAVKSARLTADGMVCGTPAYMAPEFISTGDFDRRADVYALATVAFEMLAGRLPFDHADAQRILSLKVERSAPSLGAATDRRFAHALEEVIARGLVRDPARRFQSAGEFVAALEAALAQAAREGDLVVAPTQRNQLVRARRTSTVLPRAQPQQSLRALPDSLRPQARDGARARTTRKPTIGAVLAAMVLIAWWLQAEGSARVPSPPRQPEPVAPPPIAAETATAPELQPASQPAPPSTDITEPASTAALAPEPAPRDAPIAPRRPPPHAVHVAVPQPQPPDTQPTGPSADELNRKASQELLQGRLARALELFELASTQDPRSTAAYRGLGVANERLGRTAAAARAYRRALELEPQGAQSAALRERLEKLGSEARP